MDKQMRQAAPSEPGHTAPAGRRRLPLKPAIALVAAAWVLSDAGYYLLLPLLGLRIAYNSEPVAIALYYSVWVAVAVPVFWPLYRRWPTAETPIVTHIILIGLLGGIVLFAVHGLPALPRIVWTESWEPPELMRVTPWYFVPKATEILFQQLLVAALVLALAAEGYAVRTISLACAGLFGGMHVLLALGGMPFGYVARFVAAATVFGYVFPQLLLRVPNGLACSYALHWLYYLATIVMVHSLSPYAVR
jgi:hypothetical protein